MNAWLRLCRVANLPSAASNILMAYWLAHGSWSDWPALVALLLASMSLYTAGVILNDWADAERDAKFRPERPIPAGEIAPPQALRVAMVFIGVGLASTLIAGCHGGGDAQRFDVRPLAVGLLLVGAIWSYDIGWKWRWFAPWLMGGCRGLNVLLGGATASSESFDRLWYGFPLVVWIAAAALACYTAGITWLARRESEPASLRDAAWRGESIAALIGFVAAFALWVGMFFWAPVALGEVSGQPLINYLILLGVIAVVVLRRVVAAMIRATPATTFLAVIVSLRSMITIDAAICWAAAAGAAGPPLVILALLVASLALSVVSKST